MTPRATSIGTGILLANIVGLGFLVASVLCVKFANPVFAGVFVTSTFVLIPLVMGVICAYFWDGVLSRTREFAGYTALSLVVTLLLSTIFLMEGVICLVIIFPILFGFQMLAALTTRDWLSRRRKLSITLAPLALLVLVADSVTPPTLQTTSVVDEVTINAPPHVVWEYLPAFPPIQEQSRFWLFALGLAQPIETRISGLAVGETRSCVFSEGRVFEEKIVELVPNQRVVFEVTSQPRDPEIFDHVKIERGEMRLRDNGDGTSTLTGTTWYQLRAFPTWYFTWWADEIGRAVHFRVMNHIKELAERKRESP